MRNSKGLERTWTMSMETNAHPRSSFHRSLDLTTEPRIRTVAQDRAIYHALPSMFLRKLPPFVCGVEQHTHTEHGGGYGARMLPAISLCLARSDCPRLEVK